MGIPKIRGGVAVTCGNWSRHIVIEKVIAECRRGMCPLPHDQSKKALANFTSEECRKLMAFLLPSYFSSCVYSGTFDNGLSSLRKPPQCGQEAAGLNYSLEFTVYRNLHIMETSLLRNTDTEVTPQ